MLDTHKLITLRAVAEHGSIAAAGRQLGYTRSAVSQQLSALERAAGVPLLIRDGNSVALTTIGRTLVDHTERILVELRAAEAAVGREGELVTGQLRVGVPFREGPPIMSRALSEARAQHPGLEIRLASITDENGCELVRRGDLDVVILSRYGAAHGGPAAGLQEWVLGHDGLRLCVPVEHPLTNGSPHALIDLSDQAWVISPESSLGRLIVQLCLAAGFEPRVVASVDDVATALALVGLGWGITIAPDLTAARPGAAVERIPLAGVDIMRHSILIVRDGEQLAPPIAAVVSAVLAASVGAWPEATAAA